MGKSGPATRSRLEYPAMILAIAGLGAASGVTWKGLEHHVRSPSAPEEAAELVTPPKPIVLPSPIPMPPPSVPARPRSPEGIPGARPTPPTVRPLPPSPVLPLPPIDSEGPKRVRVADESGRSVVARLYGAEGSNAVILPDGRIGWPNGLIYTEEPFRPSTTDDVARAFEEGAFRHFKRHQTDHYLIIYTCTEPFAERSGRLLERLYVAIHERFGELGIEVHEAEFPLVAVIYRNETEFHEAGGGPQSAEAFYDVLSNRIHLFETRDRELDTPELAAMRGPQTVAHEGAHQVLQNTGVQPRLAKWPPWLSEGLAEYCASAASPKGEWLGLGQPNPFHVATIRELNDPPSTPPRNANPAQGQDCLEWGAGLAELLAKPDLCPTDYAEAWALTHYLATNRPTVFAAYVTRMGQLEPLGASDEEASGEAFARWFGPNLDELAGRVIRHLATMDKGEPLPYFAALLEQPAGEGMVRRGTIVTRSPSIVRQWLASMTEGFRVPYQCRIDRHPGRASAKRSAEAWFRAR